MAILTDPELLAWAARVPGGTRGDPIWTLHTYRVALFLLHQARAEVLRIRAERKWSRIADQLLRSVASISANVAEGYGRTTPSDRARFYDITLGSLRESTSWYEDARLHFPSETVDRRINQLAELRRMLHGSIRSLRHSPPGTRLSRPRTNEDSYSSPLSPLPCKHEGPDRASDPGLRVYQ